MVVVAYGLILPQAVLDMPRLGCINVHGSLLPRWRGAAPIQRSLWAGDSETGVTIMQMDVGLDTGDMMHKIACPIESSDTSASLYDKLAQLGPQGMLTTLRQMASGSATREVQDEALVTYAEKLSKEEARLDWTLSAAQLELLYPRLQPLAGQLLHHRRSTGESVASQRTGAKRQRGARHCCPCRQARHSGGDRRRHPQFDPTAARRQETDVGARPLNSRREWFTPVTGCKPPHCPAVHRRAVIFLMPIVISFSL